MNFQFYLEKLYDSEVFKNFKKENPGAYLSSGFFVMDKLKGSNKQHIDYFVPSSKKMFSFQMESWVTLVPVEETDKRIPEKMNDNLDFVFEDVEKMIEDEKAKESVEKKTEKVLLSLQRLEGKDYLLGTVFIAGLGMLKIKIDVDEKKILEFEKKSFMDMVNVFKKK